MLAARAVNGGTTALETLSVLNNLDLGARGHNSAEALHLFIEATRARVCGQVPVPGRPRVCVRSTQGACCLRDTARRWQPRWTG